ncbi:MAG TPA: Gfo/Idh/MocA family oxidoreductase [Bacteroidales bacterium]|nr:Gfo/Idh/MocA family oxidoreductase [Bacteroidales bacterium]
MKKETKISRRNFIDKSVKASLISSVAFSGFPEIVPSTIFGKNAPSEKINIGQIGFGRIAMTHDLAETLKYDIARVVAVADLDSHRAAEGKKFIENYYAKQKQSPNFIDVKVYEDYHRLIENPEIDAVIISTPDHWHSQPAIESALAGKDIYIQKPTSLTVREGRLLSDVVRRKKVILQVGTQQRSMSQFRIAAELVRNGRIGKLETVRIGLPGDPSGPEAPEMPVPKNLNYNMWLGSTPEVYYTEMRVHPQNSITDRPGWLRCEQFGAGMITGWGQHHFDSAAWGMDTELTGPVTVEAVAQFPKSGLWDVHGDFMAKAEYANGITMLTSGGYPNGIRYEGTEGWIFVTRGNYKASPSDPVAKAESNKALDASDPAILTSTIKENETHLYISEEQHGNWLDCIRSRKEPISPVEIGHRACTVCLITHIAMKLGRRLEWDPEKELFVNDNEANSMLYRAQRAPFGTDYIKM